MPTKKLRSKSKFTLKRKVGGATEGGGAANNNFGFENIFTVIKLSEIHKHKTQTQNELHHISHIELDTFKTKLVNTFFDRVIQDADYKENVRKDKIIKHMGGKRLEEIYNKMCPIKSKKGAPPSALKRSKELNQKILESYLLFSEYKYLIRIKKMLDNKQQNRNSKKKTKTKNTRAVSMAPLRVKFNEVEQAMVEALSYLLKSREELREESELLEASEIEVEFEMADKAIEGIKNRELEARLARLRDPTVRGMKNQIIIFKNPKPKRRKPKPKPKRQIKRKIKI